MTIGLACILAAFYLTLSPVIGNTYALMLTGLVGVVLAILMLWVAGRMSDERRTR